MLTNTEIKNLKPKDKPYKVTDGGGLFILIQPTGGKLWRYKYRFLGKRKVTGSWGIPAYQPGRRQGSAITRPKS